MATPAERARIEITPTLVVGLGGTGTRVLSLFKQKMHSVCGPEAPVGFLGIDTDHERLPGAQLGTNEFALCECGLAQDIVEQLDLYEDIKRWWIPGVKPGLIFKGAKMKRPVGRLACYANYAERIRPLLEGHIRTLTRQYSDAERQRWPFEVREDNLRVYVVGSLSGGTGGGFFYDVAIAVRHIVMELTGVGKQVCVSGIIVQPRGFIKTVPMDFQREKVRANFYAGLREIEFLQRNYEEVEKPGSRLYMTLAGTPMQLRRAPFEWIYLVDTLNEKGQNISMPQLWSMIASNLCLEVYSSVTTDVENGITQNVTPTTPYASFAMASLRVPINEILDYSSLCGAKEVLETKASRARPETTEIDELSKFLASSGLFQGGTEGVSAAFTELAGKGRKVAVREEIPKQAAKQAAAIAGNEWNDLREPKKGLPAARDATSKAQLARAAEVEAAIGKRVEEMLTDPASLYGVEFMVEFSRLLEKKCIEVGKELNDKAAAIDTAALEDRIARALRELQETVSNRGGWILRRITDGGRSAQHCFESWARTVNTWAQASLKRHALAEAAKVFQRLQEVATRLKASLKEIARQLDEAAVRCSDTAKALAASLARGAGEHVLVTHMISPEDFPSIYEGAKAHLDLGRFVPLIKPKADRAVDWVNVRLEGLEQTIEHGLLPALRAQLKPAVQELGVFTGAQRYWQGSIQNWVQNALNQCSPFCNWNKAKCPKNILSMTYLGVEDANRQAHLLGDIPQGIRLASTGDPYEIVIHSLTAGYPASAVSGLGQGQVDHFFYERYCQKALEDPNEHAHIDVRWLKDGSPDLPPIT